MHALEHSSESQTVKCGHVSETQARKTRGLVICLFVASTGLFHGYDNGVVNGVFEMPSFRAHLGWPPSAEESAQTASVAFQQGLTVNGFNVGAALSALLFGTWLVDVKGRLPALRLGSALFAAGGAIQAASPSAGILISGRLVAGVGVGLTSSAGTAYIAEMAPAHSRGAMVGIYQNNICIAILIAAVLNWLVKDLHSGWRLSLGLQVVMGLVACGGLCCVPETPRFLASVGRSDEALKVLQSIRGDDATAQAEIEGILNDCQREDAAGKATWRVIFMNSTLRNVVLIGCGVQFAQWDGWDSNLRSQILQS